MAQKRLKDASDAYLLPISNATQSVLNTKADLVAGKIPAGQLPPGSTGGEINTASNTGATGAGVFKTKSGVDLQFRKVKAGSNITIVENIDDITINATGGGTGAVNSVNTRAGDVVLTSADVGLSNVNNTADASKPISTLQAAAINPKVGSIIAGTNVTVSRTGDAVTINSTGAGGGSVSSVNTRTGAVTLTKTDVSLANVDNTADSGKPVSTFQQTALDLKLDKTSVVNSLVQTVAGTALDGRQGKTLKDQMDALVVTGGGEKTLANFYGNSLSNAIGLIGATPTRLIIDANTLAVTTAISIPTTLRLKFRNEGKIVFGTGGSIIFLGDGLVNPMSHRPIFSGFPVDAITWTGTNYPPEISANLWDDVNWGTKFQLVTGAFTNKKVKIHVYEGGTALTVIRLKQYQQAHFHAGTYQNQIPTYRNFIVESDTKVSGDGMFNTFIKETSHYAQFTSTINGLQGITQQNQLITASGIVENPFAEYNENIEVCDIGFKGQIAQAVDSSASMVLLGNVKNGHIRRCSSDRIHGFSFFLGGNGNFGYAPKDSSITDCWVGGARTQAIGYIQGNNVEISRNNFYDINPTILKVTDAVSNGTFTPFFFMGDFICNQTTITSATGGFANWQIGATFKLFVPSQLGIDGVVGEVINANTIVLNTGVPFAATNISLELTGTTGTMIDGEPNNQYALASNVSICDNRFDGRGSRQSWSMITVHAGGRKSTRNVTITGNVGIGADLLGTTPVQDIDAGFMTYGIAIGGVNTGIITNNHIQKGSQEGILVSASRRITCAFNNILATGGANNSAITLDSVADSTIAFNIVKSTYPDGYAGTVSDGIKEIQTSGTVNISGTTVTRTGSSSLGFQPFYKGLSLKIANVLHPILSVATDLQSVTIGTNLGTQSNIVAVPAFSNNQFNYNQAGLITLATGSTSVINAIGAGGGGGLDANGVRATDLTGLGTGDGTAIAPSDSILGAFAKSKFQLANPNANSYSVGGTSVLSINGSNFTVLGNGGNSVQIFTPQEYHRDGAFTFYKSTNKTATTLDRDAQFNFSGTANDASAAADTGIKRSAAGVVKITNGGAGSGNLEAGILYLNDGTVKQVTFGAVDSGGTGFKMLRIAN